MASFHNNVSKLVPDCQITVDFVAARDDGGGTMVLPWQCSTVMEGNSMV